MSNILFKKQKSTIYNEHPRLCNSHSKTKTFFWGFVLARKKTILLYI